MSRETLVKDLREFGLSEYEAKAYLALTIHGPLAASSVSEFSKIPQSKVYGILKSLSTKFLAETWNGKPIKFKAVEPLHALKKMVEKKKMVIDSLKEKTESILEQLKPLRNFKEEGFGLWSSTGKMASMEKGAEMISRAKEFGIATTSRFSRYPVLDNAYISALKKGVKIRMIGTSELDEAKRARASWYAKQGAEIRILPMSIHPIMGLVDDKEVCVRIDNSPDPDVIWTNNPALLNVFRVYFEELWDRAKKVKLN